MTKDEVTSVAAIIAASTAVVNILVTIVNIFLNSKNQRRSTFATVVSSNRVRWIEDIRKDIAQYIGLMTAVRGLKNLRSETESSIHTHLFMQTEEDRRSISIVDDINKNMTDKLDQAVILQSLLQMKLDTSQIEQLNVFNKVQEISSRNNDDASFIKSIEDLTYCTRILLNKEWERVERLR